MKGSGVAIVFVAFAGLMGGEAKTPSVKEMKSRVKDAVERGISFLRKNQNEDGSYGEYHDVGVTALCVAGMARSPKAYRQDDGPFISNAVEFLLANVQEDGSIMNKNQGLANYKTCASILALVSVEDPKLKPVIEKAKNFVVGLQASEQRGYDPQKHKKAYGGIGYGGDQRPDLSNTQFALDALKSAGLERDSKVWKRVIVFLNRCQNYSETNDMQTAGNDGGGIYAPGDSKAGKLTLPNGKVVFKSYGSMTYALLRCFLLAGVGKDDPRVQAAYRWLQKHYTLDENPEMGTQGLYYYYLTLAEALRLYGDPYFMTADGKRHLWANELAEKLLSLQKEDGSWVNETSRWWESDKVLCTAYAILALDTCYKVLGSLE